MLLFFCLLSVDFVSKRLWAKNTSCWCFSVGWWVQGPVIVAGSVSVQQRWEAVLLCCQLLSTHSAVQQSTTAAHSSNTPHHYLNNNSNCTAGPLQQHTLQALQQYCHSTADHNTHMCDCMWSGLKSAQLWSVGVVCAKEHCVMWTECSHIFSDRRWQQHCNKQIIKIKPQYLIIRLIKECIVN